MRVETFASIALLAVAPVAAGRAQQGNLPTDVGVYAETTAGTIPLKKTFSGFDVAGTMAGSSRTRALVFPIPTAGDVPVGAAKDPEHHPEPAGEPPPHADQSISARPPFLEE